MAKTDPRIDEHNPRTVITDGGVTFDAPEAEPEAPPQDQVEEPEEVTAEVTAGGHRRRGPSKKTKLIALGTAVAAVAGVAGLSLFKGGDSSEPQSASTEEPSRINTSQLASQIQENLPVSRAEEGYNRWVAERNLTHDGKPAWANRPTSVPGGGVNYPEGSNPVNEEFGDIILSDWQSREAVMSTGVEDPYVHWTEGVMVFIEYKGKVYAVDRLIMYGCFVNEDNLNDKTPDPTDPKVTFYGSIIKMPDGKLVSIFFEEDGVGFPSLRGVKVVGTFIDEVLEQPVIQSGSGAIENGVLTVTDESGTSHTIESATEYDNLEQAAKAEQAKYGNGWTYASNWKLTKKFPAAG